MSRIGPTQRLMPSLLDRLIDPDAGGTAEGQGYNLVQMIESVRRDLEELLNTRQTCAGIPLIYTEIYDSIVAYGMPDMTMVNAATTGERSKLGRVIEAIVAKYEPRLRDIRATLVPSKTKTKSDPTVRFSIEARLNVEPSPEVGFQTILELMTGQASVKPQGV
jgi:type VI secretion system protein ImpF